MANISDLLGKTLVIASHGVYDDGDAIFFETNTGEKFVMYHSQDCCESVYIESIEGNLESLIGNEILVAEETDNDGVLPEYEYASDSYTWTFYKLATIKGHVDIRWFGSSNGYYSERVDFAKEINGKYSLWD